MHYDTIDADDSGNGRVNGVKLVMLEIAVLLVTMVNSVMMD